MAFKYKVVSRGEPGVTGGGNIKYYPVADNHNRIDLSQLAIEISRRSTMGRADVVGVLTALVDIIPQKLATNHIVELGELGSMRLSLKGTGEESVAAVSKENITGNKIVYSPAKDIKQRLLTLDYTKK